MVLQADVVNGNLRHMEGWCHFRSVLFSYVCSFATARAELAKTMRTIGLPSEIIKSPTSIRAFVEAINRPGPPTALFSPELALLQYDLEHLDDLDPDPADLAFSRSLNENAGGPTNDAGEREAVLRLILGRFLEKNSEGQVLTTGRTWLEGSFTYPIIEIMHGFGDSSLQGLVVYSKTIAQEEVWFSLRPFYSAVIPRTVSKIPQPVEPASCPTRYLGEQARHFHCYLHRLRLRQQATLALLRLWVRC